jgi:hypothetical protein
MGASAIAPYAGMFGVKRTSPGHAAPLAARGTMPRNSQDQPDALEAPPHRRDCPVRPCRVARTPARPVPESGRPAMTPAFTTAKWRPSYASAR